MTKEETARRVIDEGLLTDKQKIYDDLQYLKKLYETKINVDIYRKTAFLTPKQKMQEIYEHIKNITVKARAEILECIERIPEYSEITDFYIKKVSLTEEQRQTIIDNLEKLSDLVCDEMLGYYS